MRGRRRTGVHVALRIASLGVLVGCLAPWHVSGPVFAQQPNEPQSEEDRRKALQEALQRRRQRQQQQQPAAAPQAPVPAVPAAPSGENLTPEQRLNLIEQSQQTLQQRLLQQERVLFEQDQQLRGQFNALQEQADTIRSQQEIIDTQNQQLLDLRTQLRAGPAPASDLPRAGNAVPQTPPPATGVRSPEQNDRAAALRRAQAEARARQQQQQQQRAAQPQQPAAPVPQAPVSRAPQSDPALASNQRRATRPPVADRPPDVEAVPEEAGVLTPKNELSLDLSVSYTYSDVNRVEIAGFTVLPAVAIGNFDIREVDRQSFVTSATLRYGLTNRIEFEARLPFVHRNDLEVGRPLDAESNADEITQISGGGLGDIEFGLRHQLNRGQNGWPFFTYGLRVKTTTGRSPFDIEDPERQLPTGTGLWAVTPSISAILPTDPGVLYASASYSLTLPKFFEDFGKINPGDTFAAGLGLGFSLNPKVSLSIGTNYSVTFRTRNNGTPVDGSTPIYSGSLSFGYSYRFNPQTSVSFNVSPGFTSDAPDLQMSLRMPIRF